MQSGLKSWYFVTVDFAFGHALQRDATAAIEAEGGKVLGAVRHPFNMPDFSLQCRILTSTCRGQLRKTRPQCGHSTAIC